MVLKRRNKKFTGKISTVGARKFVVCKECESEEVEVPFEVSSVICAYCVQKMIAPPENYEKNKNLEKKPKGWNFKPFIELNGKVYSKGVEVTDSDQIKILRKKFGKKVKSKNDRIT